MPAQLHDIYIANPREIERSISDAQKALIPESEERWEQVSGFTCEMNSAVMLDERYR